MNLLSEYNIARKHIITKTHTLWRNNEKIDSNTKNKVSEILQPVINHIIKENIYTEEQKETIKNNALEQDKIYTKHLNNLKN